MGIQPHIRRFQALQQQYIHRVYGGEMAFFNRGPHGLPVFAHPDLPFLQLWNLYFEVAPEEWLVVLTHQDGTEFGLDLRHESGNPMTNPEGSGADAASSTRMRELPAFPTGRIDQVTCHLSGQGNVNEVHLRIAGHLIALVAGEVSEDWDHFRILKDDESVLVFFSLADLQQVTWDDRQVLWYPGG
jgi:uncharacterized Zn-binding protein involved in type VI secretion